MAGILDFEILEDRRNFKISPCNLDLKLLKELYCIDSLVVVILF